MATERRSHPRYAVACDVVVTLPDGDGVFGGTSIQLSRTSLEFSCKSELVSALLKQQRLPYSCKVEFSLPWHSHRYVIEANVVTQRRLSQQQYVLALLLRHQNPRQEEMLGNMLERNAERGERKEV